MAPQTKAGPNTAPTLRPYKFVVQAVVQQLDADGNVIGEPIVGREDGTPFVLYGCDALAEFAKNFPATLNAAEAEQA